MKQFVIIILSIILLSACGNREHMQFEKLQQIDSIAEVNADSAVALINAINRDSLLSDDNKYYYDLLKIRTNDKAYIAHTSDSAILSVINYFENNDFNNLLPVAYYYGGRVYSDLGDAPQALEYFHKALDCENISTHTMAVVYAQIAEIYSRQKIHELAIPTYKKTISLNLKNKNTIGAIYNIRNLGTIYLQQNKADSAIILFNEAIKLSKQINNTKLTSSIELNLAESYILENNHIKAKETLSSIKDFLSKEDSIYITNTFAHLYYQLNNLDSTIFYCNKLIESNSIYAQQNGYNILSNIYLNNKDVNNAINYMSKSQECFDSINKRQTPQEIQQLSAIYNYQIRERENNKLKQEAQENEIKIISLISSIVIIIVIALFTIHIVRKRKRIIKLKLQNVEMLLKQSNDYSENTIAENIEKISLLEKQIESINSENTSLIQELEQQKKLLELNNEKANIFKIQKDNAIIAFNNDTFIIDLHNRLKNYPEGKNIISEKEWNILSEKTSTLFPTLINTLRELPFKLSLYEFRVSILIKTKFTPKEIARLTNHSESSVSITRIRLYKKLTNIDGHTYDWDNFINNV